MSGFLSERLISEGGDSRRWLCCQRCPHLKDCPYVCNQVLRCAARQGHTAAQLLNTEASRLLETISSAGDIRCLLNGGGALENTLSHVLRSEMAMFDSLCTQTTKPCP